MSNAEHPSSSYGLEENKVIASFSQNYEETKSNFEQKMAELQNNHTADGYSSGSEKQLLRELGKLHDQLESYNTKLESEQITTLNHSKTQLKSLMKDFQDYSKSELGQRAQRVEKSSGVNRQAYTQFFGSTEDEALFAANVRKAQELYNSSNKGKEDPIDVDGIVGGDVRDKVIPFLKDNMYTDTKKINDQYALSISQPLQELDEARQADKLDLATEEGEAVALKHRVEIGSDGKLSVFSSGNIFISEIKEIVNFFHENEVDMLAIEENGKYTFTTKDKPSFSVTMEGDWQKEILDKIRLFDEKTDDYKEYIVKTNDSGTCPATGLPLERGSHGELYRTQKDGSREIWGSYARSWQKIDKEKNNSSQPYQLVSK